MFWNRGLRRSGASAGVAGRVSWPRLHLTRSIRPGHGRAGVHRTGPAAATGVEEREPRCRAARPDREGPTARQAGPGGAPLSRSPPNTATTHTPCNRQRYCKCQQPSSSLPLPPCAPKACRPAGATERGTGPAARLPVPRGTRRPASRTGEPPSPRRRCRSQRPSTRPPPDSAAARAAAPCRRRSPPHTPEALRTGGAIVRGNQISRPLARSVRNQPPGMQGRETAWLSPSPPSPVTMCTPATRQRCGKGRRPFLVAALPPHTPAARRPTTLQKRPPTLLVAADNPAPTPTCRPPLPPLRPRRSRTGAAALPRRPPLRPLRPRGRGRAG